jgi:hypothetical protein
MLAMTVPPRLSQLLELAGQGPSLRASLAEEIAELLAAWPADCPPVMRGMCETLLAEAARDADSDMRLKLRLRLRADPELAARVLPREAQNRALIQAARCGAPLGEDLARLLGVETRVAEDILRDGTGTALAIAVKAAHLGRSDFSALALLCHPKSDRAGAYELLDVYDGIKPADAIRTLRAWRGGQASPHPEPVEA